MEEEEEEEEEAAAVANSLKSQCIVSI